MAESNVDLQALRGRDRSAWALLYDSLVHGTYGLVWKLTGGDRTTCEDLNQEIWLSAIDSIEKFDAQRGTVKSWIFGIARFKALQHLRQTYRDPTIQHAPSLGTQPVLEPVSTASTETIEIEERAAVIQAALATLSTEQRDALHCKYVEGQSVTQIANKFGKTPKAVESMLSRARSELRALLRCTLE